MTGENREQISEVVEMNKLNFDKPVVIGGFVLQARVVSISEAANDYAMKVHKELKAAGIRVDADVSDKTMEYKIRDAKMQQIPYTIVLGKKEQEAGSISVRNRDGKQTNAIGLQDFIGRVSKEIAGRSQGLSY